MIPESGIRKLRYYGCVFGSWFLLAIGLYTSGGGKTQPSPGEVMFAWTFCLLALVAMVFAILSLPREERTSRSWEPIVSLLIVGGMSAIVVPVLWGAKGASKRTLCISAGKQIGAAFLIYTTDYDDRFPPSRDWMSVLEPYLKNRTLYKCPASQSSFDYAMSEALSIVKLAGLADVQNTVLDFECDSSVQSPVGGREDFAPRHDRRGTIAFADGRAKMIPGNATGVRWTP